MVNFNSLSSSGYQESKSAQEATVSESDVVANEESFWRLPDGRVLVVIRIQQKEYNQFKKILDAWSTILCDLCKNNLAIDLEVKMEECDRIITVMSSQTARKEQNIKMFICFNERGEALTVARCAIEMDRYLHLDALVSSPMSIANRRHDPCLTKGGTVMMWAIEEFAVKQGLLGIKLKAIPSSVSFYQRLNFHVTDTDPNRWLIPCEKNLSSEIQEIAS